MELTPDAPRARSHALIVRDLDEETLVYDSDRDEAICMNAVAADVWRRCDGSTTPAAIAAAIATARGCTIDERIVWFALAELKAKKLIDEPFELPLQVRADLERRAFLKTLGGGAGLLFPVVASIIVPTPAQAQSCLPATFLCTQNSQCCSGLCVAAFVCA